MAIIELAAASGLWLLAADERNPPSTSTYGTNLLLKNAIEKGVEKIILGIGGSATNDAGTGILCALGFTLLNDKGDALLPCGKNLSLIHQIIPPAYVPNVPIDIACDVQNTLYGKQGGAFVYAPQKGASPDDVLVLDKGLQHFAYIIQQQKGIDISALPGTGAAGGIAAGLLPFFSVSLTKGIDMVIEASGIKKSIAQANVVFTGEGRIDAQSFQGKVVGYIAGLCAQHRIPMIALCGQMQLSLEEVQQLKAYYVTSIVNAPISLPEAMGQSGNLLKQEAARCMLFYNKMQERKRAGN